MRGFTDRRIAMVWLNKKGKVTDERIIIAQNKIYREIYTVIMVICLLSIVIKLYLYDTTSIKLIITECIILFLSSGYYMARSASLGIFSDEVEIHDRTSKTPMSSKNIYIGLSIGVLIGLFFGVRSAFLYGDGYLNSIFTFAIVLCASLMIYVPFFLLIISVPFLAAKKASLKAAEKDLNDED